MSVISEERKLPSTWRWVRCQDVVDVRDGTHDTPTKTNFGIPLITSKNLTPQGIDFSNITYISEEDHQSIEKRSAVDDGDVLFAMIGTIGNPVIVEKDRRFSIKNVALFKLNKSLYYPPFFKELLNTSIIRKQLARNTKGGNQKFVSLSVLRNLVIPLPPLEEQKRIAEILDRAEELRSKRREAIAQLDTLTQAIFLEMFGDPVTNLKGWKRLPFAQLLTNIDSGWSPVCLDRPVYGEEWGVLKLGAVTWCEYNPTENKALPLGVEPNPALEVKTGDLLFTRKNTYELVGACAIVRETPPRLLMPDLIFRFRLRADAAVNPYFLHQLLIYPTKRRNIQKLAGGSASSMPNISKAKLQTTLIEVPPLNLQQEFADRVEAVEKLKAAHRASLSELDALFGSLQHRAFRGEL